jgi:hypothetical protein
MKKNLNKSFFEAPWEVQSMIISSNLGALGWDRYCKVVLKYPEWFDEDDVKHIQKLKDEEINNINPNNTSTTEL